MDVFNFLWLVTIFIIILVNNSAIKDRLDKLKKDVTNLANQLDSLQSGQIVKKQEPKKESEIKPEPIMNLEAEATTILPKPAEITLEDTKPSQIVIEQPVNQVNYSEKIAEPAISKEQVVKPKKKGDLEKFIGENLMGKIGILVLVLGIGYFVKYAIDNNYINEIGRTAIGILAGGALIGIAHRMRKNYKTFASILIGGGFAVLYTTITIAYQLYSLFPQSVAFTITIILTFFAVLLSLLYDKKELAIFSLIGGFASPFMVASGQSNYIVLFSYLFILNSGMVAISWYKRWHILNILGYIFTLILFGSWLADTFIWTSSPKPFGGAFIFTSLFYIGFFLVNVLNNIRKFQSFNGIEITMILSNNLFYFLSGLLILNTYQDGIYKGLFTAGLGVYNFLWVSYLYKKQQIDKTLVYLMIGLVLSFISLAIPIQLNGHSITLFWSAEVVILIWISQVSGIKLLKTGHVLILLLTIISLLMDWNNIYHGYNTSLPLFFNQACITGIIVVLSIVITLFFLKKEKEPYFIQNILDIESYKVILSFLMVIGLYSVLLYEIWYQMNRLYEVASFRQTVYSIYNFTYITAIIFICKWQKWINVEKVLYILSLVFLFVFMVFYSNQIIITRDNFLNYNQLTNANYLVHYLVYPSIMVLLSYLIRNKDLVFKQESLWKKATQWYFLVFILVVASIELDNLILYINNANYNTSFSLLKHIHRIGYPILWACMALITMIIGMKYKNKLYRIQAISLLGLIILKLLFIDVWQMSAGGRVATFIFLGIVLLVISFLYQKLKQFILEEEQNN